MNSTQLTIADVSPAGGPLTVADLDEWIAHVETCLWDTSHWPNPWARAGLGALLGESVPHRRWLTRDLLETLRRARSLAQIA